MSAHCWLTWSCQPKPNAQSLKLLPLSRLWDWLCGSSDRILHSSLTFLMWLIIPAWQVSFWSPIPSLNTSLMTWSSKSFSSQIPGYHKAHSDQCEKARKQLLLLFHPTLPTSPSPPNEVSSFGKLLPACLPTHPPLRWKAAREIKITRGCEEVLFYFLYFFWPCHMTFGTIVPQPGIKPGPPAVQAWSPNHWAAREVPSRGS